ncbi:MAG: hypothetical protein HY966_04945, partial [Ignavibacteriales bacterium]|nr:hypothetical protein [Ignavibacteriales bacterium]
MVVEETPLISHVMNRSPLHRTLWFIVVATLAASSGCFKEHTSQLLSNKTPKTFFWLYADTSVATGVSRQQLRWWGEDPDGYVIGYLISIAPDLTALPNPDTLTYKFVTTTDSVIAFPLRQAQQSFLVSLRAIDNTFKWALPSGAAIKVSPPFPYWDKNKNGQFDDGTDVKLDGLMSAMDPDG